MTHTGLAGITRFDAAAGLYWYAADYHEGQGSTLYRILSTLGYWPGACERGPTEPEAEDVYRQLESGLLNPEDVAEYVHGGKDND